MFNHGWILAALLVLMPATLLAETIEGRLDRVSFNEEFIEVDGVVYEVNTESTRVIYHGENLGEEDLRPGDDVKLIIGRERGRKEKRELQAVILVRGSKSGLDS